MMFEFGNAEVRKGSKRSKGSKELRSAANKEIVSKASFFANRSPEFHSELAQQLECESFLEGETIMREGEQGHKMYTLVRGTVQVLTGVEEKKVAVLSDGSVFGEMALFGIPKRAATVRALESCDCRSISHSVFYTILQKFPAERKFFTEMAAERKKKLEQVQRAEKGPTLRPEEIEDHLKNVEIFSRRDPAFIREMSKSVELETILPMRYIFREGSESYKTYVIAKGSVELLSGPDQKLVTIVAEDGVLAEDALVGLPLRTCTARTLELCDCVVINHPVFLVTLNKFPAEKRFFLARAQEKRKKLQKKERDKDDPGRSHSVGSASSTVSADSEQRESGLEATRGREVLPPTSTPKSQGGFRISNAGRALVGPGGAAGVDLQSPRQRASALALPAINEPKTPRRVSYQNAAVATARPTVIDMHAVMAFDRRRRSC